MEKKNKNLQIRIQSWEHYAMVLQSYRAVYYFGWDLHCSLVKVTFEIKSKIKISFTSRMVSDPPSPPSPLNYNEET